MLGDDELQRLEEACDMSLELNQSKHRIYEYVESKMSFIAPNLSIIVGASTAAKIMGENKTVELRIVSCPKITIVVPTPHDFRLWDYLVWGNHLYLITNKMWFYCKNPSR